MNKLGVVITDGVGYRNFILSDFLLESTKEYDLVIIYSGLPKSCFSDFELADNIVIKELEVFQEDNRTWFFRKLKEVAHMFKHRSYYGIKNNLLRGYPKNNSKRSLVIKLVYLIAKYFHSEKSIANYEKLQCLSFKNNTTTKAYINVLKADKPRVLFFTHQRPPYLSPFLYASKLLNIHSSVFIFSWDNLASKGRMMGGFNSYLVWSNLMKDEMNIFYPNVSNESIAIIGTPQFEPYVIDRYKTPKDDFYGKFNLDENKKIICYSCADAGIGANDSIHIKSVMNFINKYPELNLQLLVRTSPAEDGMRFLPLKNEFPSIKWNFPKWNLTRNDHVESWSQRVPSIEDIIDLKSILTYSDLNINMCSTMSLDFMLFDKPVINTVFGNDSNGLYDDQKFLNYIHYKYVIESEAVTIAKNEKELHEQIKESLIFPKLRAKNRKELINLEISKELKDTSKRIVRTLLTMDNEN